MNPPPVKVGPGRPRKKRRRDPHENPKKPGKLTKHGIEMSCSVCKSLSHNKRKCPHKDRQIPPPPLRPMGRRRKTVIQDDQASQMESQLHQTATALPSRTGRGGRLVKPRGGGTTGQRGKEKGKAVKGRGPKAPQGIGVLVDDSGNAYTHEVGSSSGTRNVVNRVGTQELVGTTRVGTK